MTIHSICFAGLSRDEQGQVEAAFREANAGQRWQLASESEAAVVVVDMDSMYGQMSLMKALSNGKVVVALTAGGRVDTDYRLDRPVTAAGIARLLADIGAATPAAPAPEAPADAAPTPAPVAVAEPVAAPAPAPVPAPQPEPEPAPAAAPAPPADPRLADFLRPGVLAGPVRVQLEGAPPLVIDPAGQVYLSGQALKPLAPYATADIRESDLAPVDPGQLPALASELGGSHPLSRLAWLLALAGHGGQLAPGHGLNDRYKLLKWPQTEREFPRHFRIATVMMKGPALLTEIAELSGVPLPEVCDYVNAALAAGVAEAEQTAPSEPEAAKGGGLLGRFRR